MRRPSLACCEFRVLHGEAGRLDETAEFGHAEALVAVAEAGHDAAMAVTRER
jgi:hypothetical protein